MSCFYMGPFAGCRAPGHPLTRSALTPRCKQTSAGASCPRPRRKPGRLHGPRRAPDFALRTSARWDGCCPPTGQRPRLRREQAAPEARLTPISLPPSRLRVSGCCSIWKSCSRLTSFQVSPDGQLKITAVSPLAQLLTGAWRLEPAGSASGELSPAPHH